MAAMTGNLTEGVVWKRLLRFSVPMLIANLLQAVYGLVDMLVIGRFMTTTAGLSAVTNGSQTVQLINTLIFGLCVGGQVVVGQYFGAKKMDGVKRTIGTMLCFCVVLGVAIPAVFIPLSRPILHAMHTPAEAFRYAFVYMAICLGGTVCVAGYQAIAAILRGLGDARRPLWFILIAACFNIVLDLIFVGVLQMGPAGAAVATVIAQCLALICALIYLFRRTDLGFRLRGKDLRLSGPELRLVVKVGVPSAIQYVFVNFAAVFVTSLVNRYGVDVSAAIGAAARVEVFSLLPHQALGSAVSAMVAQNMGAERVDRVSATVKSGIRMAFIWSLVAVFCFQVFPARFMTMFSDNPMVITQGALYLRIMSVACLLGCLTICIHGLVIGIGFSKFAMINTLIPQFCVRIVLAWVLNVALGCPLWTLYLCTMLAPVCSVPAAVIYYLSGRWKNRRLLKPSAKPTEEA